MIHDMKPIVDEHLRIQCWHATYNAVVQGLLAGAQIDPFQLSSISQYPDYHLFESIRRVAAIIANKTHGAL